MTKRKIKKGNHPADIDVLLVTALFKPEYTALQNQLEKADPKYNIKAIKQTKADIANRITRWTMTPSVAAYSYTIGTVHLSKMGQADSALETYFLGRTHTPKLIILCGIAGTLDPKQLGLGDVIIATAVDWRNADKILHDRTCPTPQDYRIEIRPRFRQEYKGGAINCALNVAEKKCDQLPSNTPGSTAHDLRLQHFAKAKENKIVVGPVLTSSFVLNHKMTRDDLAKQKLLAIEMEAAGAELARQMLNENYGDKGAVELIVIRGICDECHDKKDTAWRPIASENAMWTAMEYLVAYLT